MSCSYGQRNKKLIILSMDDYFSVQIIQVIFSLHFLMKVNFFFYFFFFVHCNSLWTNFPIFFFIIVIPFRPMYSLSFLKLCFAMSNLVWQKEYTSCFTHVISVTSAWWSGKCIYLLRSKFSIPKLDDCAQKFDFKKKLANWSELTLKCND